MKILLIIFLLFPSVLLSQELFTKRMFPMICMPSAMFEQQQKRLDEKTSIFGILEDSPDILFEVHKNSDEENPTFTATLRRGKETCVLVAGQQLVPVWWFSEKGL
tara:strand:+ start:721 stop:1035 length:315 start_codon:yes stop_codon:yes gene_type:complete